jgi:hypothetical protein
MKSKHFFLAALVVLVALVTYSSLKSAFSYSRFPGDKGAAYETAEMRNESFRVRITAFRETGIFTPGAFFVFESAPLDSDDWQAFWDYRADEPVSIPREQFHFVNDRTAYFYGYNDFLMTNNAGQSWSHWKPALPDSGGKTYQWGIREANIDACGKGKMKLERYDEQLKARATSEIFTENFGQSWNQTAPRR